MSTIDAVIVGLFGWLLLIFLAVLVLCRTQLRELVAGLRSRGEVAGTPADDWMDIAEVVSDDHAASLLNRPAPGLEGFTPLEAETLQRNYLPMTDDERFRLDMAWRSIVEGADR